jgi:hypothetical protein
MIRIEFLLYYLLGILCILLHIAIYYLYYYIVHYLNGNFYLLTEKQIHRFLSHRYFRFRIFIKSCYIEKLMAEVLQP